MGRPEAKGDIVTAAWRTLVVVQAFNRATELESRVVAQKDEAARRPDGEMPSAEITLIAEQFPRPHSWWVVQLMRRSVEGFSSKRGDVFMAGSTPKARSRYPRRYLPTLPKKEP